MSSAPAGAIVLRPTTAADVAACAEWDTDALPPHMFPDRWRPDGRSLVAVCSADPERVVGTAYSCRNRVHPVRDLAGVAVRPDHRRRGIGTRLVRALWELGAGPLDVGLTEGDPAVPFWLSLGAVPIQTCPPMVLPVSGCRTGGEADSEELAAHPDLVPLLERWAAPHGTRVLSVAEATAELGADAIALELATVYQWQHASWSPTAPYDVLLAKVGRPYAEDLDPRLSRVVLREGDAPSIAALCAVYPEELRPILTVEAHDPATRTARREVACALAAAVLACRDAGLDLLEFDGHVTDPHFAPLLAQLPGTTGRPYVRFDVPAPIS